MPVSGSAAPGYEAVLAEFQRNLDERGELGAAFAAYRGPTPLVDIWGGVADRSTRTHWRRETLQTFFSGTKGLVAVCMLILIERGLLKLDAPVARYWPEFAAKGKGRILVRDAVSHRAGLPVVAAPLEIQEALDADQMAKLLAAQAPLPVAEGELYYHALTFGWLCSELVRRVDGRTVGQFFADEVASRLDLELWIGLPADLEHRVATLELSSTWGAARSEEPPADGIASLLRSGNPAVFDHDGFPWNFVRFHAGEIAGAGAIGSARSMAKLYACLAAGGELGSVRIMNEDTVRLGKSEISRGHEPVVDAPLAFGVGFELQTEHRRLGPPDDAFGHTGAGGSVHGAWPTIGVGFSYAMNLLRDDHFVDERAAALLEALHAAATP